VEISISDSGVGISPADIPKLFRIDVNHSTKGTMNERGTGLGLILCKEFVEKHGGKIWVDSEIGRGSVFTMTLPMPFDDYEHEN
jgi:signal transduction histidine kinase